MSLKRFLLIFCVSLLSSMLAGCKEVKYYGYELASQELSGGVLRINFVGNYREAYEESGGSFLEWGFPYNLQFSFSCSGRCVVEGLVIKEVKLLGLKTNNQYEFSDLGFGDPKLYDGRKVFRASIGPLTAENFQYEDYQISGVAQLVNSGSQVVREEFVLFLKTDFRIEKRSDFFDEATSI
ncbi:hypothetical protein PVT68_09075 [Microbulbifer bruguierae]|uniref:Lipoprotein n=1 Tax=Microbulbifer bruguierae TaxID=3029061 RepID=A0ABY8NHY7_9GAMM|nr:hypothetical protein [Microbulbifer bruguierae]WGL18433.1 hypothetical protein PVT68_09075 [Microbulbifer bruguierae]